jgi:hypothetical protein
MVVDVLVPKADVVPVLTNPPPTWAPQVAVVGCDGASGSHLIVAAPDPVAPVVSVAVTVNVDVPGVAGEAAAVVDVGYGDENVCAVGDPPNP